MTARPVQTIDSAAAAPAALFKLGMRRLAAGVSLVTSSFEGTPVGFIATSVTSVTADPATLLVCANSATTAHDPIDLAGVFCVNLLGRGDEEIAAQFSSSTRRDERFLTGSWSPTGTGSPALASAMAWFDCVIETRIRHHTHTIFLARVVDIGIGTATITEPLVYFDQKYL